MKTDFVSKHELYSYWASMKSRCYNGGNVSYGRYGGRGISVCSQWLGDPMAFYKWGEDNGYEPGLSLDRIDNDGDYEPSNCRWITMSEQQRNKRTSLYFEYDGRTQCLKTWCEELLIDYNRTRARIMVYGWSVKKAFEEDSKVPRYKYRKGYLTLKDLSIKYKVPLPRLKNRVVVLKWDIKRAIEEPVRKFKK